MCATELPSIVAIRLNCPVRPSSYHQTPLLVASSPCIPSIFLPDSLFAFRCVRVDVPCDHNAVTFSHASLPSINVHVQILRPFQYTRKLPLVDYIGYSGKTLCMRPDYRYTMQLLSGVTASLRPLADKSYTISGVLHGFAVMSAGCSQLNPGFEVVPQPLWSRKRFIARVHSSDGSHHCISDARDPSAIKLGISFQAQRTRAESARRQIRPTRTQ
jgi:hypothetical protein